VRQDIRGTKQSGGSFEVWHDAATDAYDTMAWIVKQTWSNGVVFTTGASADAIDELAQLPQFHPALRGQLIVFATSDGYGTFFPGGAYRESLIDGWLKDTVPTQYNAVDSLVRNEEQPGRPWWDAVNGSMYYDHVTFPSIAWGGWYDIFQSGQFKQFKGYQYEAAPEARGLARLVMDPCGHCQAAADLFPQDLVFGRVLLPILMAFDMMSNDDPQNKTWPPIPEGVKNVTLYVMGDDEGGAKGNYWTTLDALPEATDTDMYLGSAGALLPVPEASAAGKTYTYDPADPVKTIGGDNLLIPCGPLDQRPNEELNRQDLLLFTSEPLAEPLAVVGGVSAKIYFSTNVVDTDIVVKLIDVYPDNSTNKGERGASILVLDGIARAKWRHFPASNDPALLSGDPATTYEVVVDLWNTAYVFGANHRVRVHVTSSNFNRFWPNPNTGLWMNETQGSKNITATTTIHFGGAAATASHVTLPVVPLSALPAFPVEEAVTSMLARHAPRWEANVRRREEGDVDFKTWLMRRLEKVWRTVQRSLAPVASE